LPQFAALLREKGGQDKQIKQQLPGQIKGYLHVCVRPYQNEKALILRDFFVTEDVFNQDRGKFVFAALLQLMLEQLIPEGMTKFENIQYPLPLFLETPASQSELQVDSGVMYRVVDEEQLSHQQLEILLHPSQHVFWDVDGF